MAGWLRVSLVALAAATSLTGCTSDESAGRLLGDLATIDPCSLTSLDVFERFGAVEFAVPETFGSCAVLITPSGDDSAAGADDPEEITLFVGALLRPSAISFSLEPELEEVADSIYLTGMRDLGASCAQELVFAEEDLALTVQTRMSPTATPVPTCDLTAAGMARVVEVILDGKVGHRSPSASSLTGVDACDLLDEETVTDLPGFADARFVDWPGRHECHWRTGRGELNVSVKFLVGPPPKVGTGQSGADPVAGRATVTDFSGPSERSGGRCQVETGHIPFDEVAGVTGVVEIVRVDVELPVRMLDGVEEADRFAVGCQGAIEIATHAWGELPPA